MGTDLSRLDLLLARHFVVLAEECNFSRAAVRLHLSQSALSKQIRTLERQVGATLVDRSRRPCVLTADGDEVLWRSRDILARVQVDRPRTGGLTPAAADPRTGWTGRPWSGSRRSPEPGSPAAAPPARLAPRPAP